MHSQLNRYERQQEEKKEVFFFRKWLKKVLEQSQSAVTEIKNKSGLQIKLNFKVRNHCFVSNITSPINKMFMTLTYFKNSQSQHCC